MPHTILKIGDLDLDLLGQIGLQTSKIFTLTETLNHFEFYLPTYCLLSI